MIYCLRTRPVKVIKWLVDIYELLDILSNTVWDTGLGVFISSKTLHRIKFFK